MENVSLGLTFRGAPKKIRNKLAKNMLSAVDITATAEIDGDSPISIEGSGSQSISRLRGDRSREVDFKIKEDSI